MIIGMDFGTTNSGVAVFDGRQLRPIPFGSATADGTITRTALYVTNDQTVTIGRAAIDRYQEHNLGRPVRMERFKIGMTSITYPDIGTVLEDIFSERDVLAPGRLFLSFKSSLSSVGYRGTVVGNALYEIEDIVAIYLYVAKLRAERALGRTINAVVLGRPVHFASEPEADALAERRLIEAAWRAGYETVYLQYEPVAVALEYATSVTREQHVLVFDFGGGTLDLAVMRLDGRGQRTVLATGGIPIAGDVFDQRVVRNQLAQRLGEGTTFGPRNKRRVVPSWIYDDLANWQTIVLIQAARHGPLLHELLATTDRPEMIAPLIEIVTQNHGLTMFDAVEQAKRALSTNDDAIIALLDNKLDLREPITRPAFEQLIQMEVRAVDRLIDTVLHNADLTHHDIDMVVRTGGSSQIPIFVDLLTRKFGRDRVRAVNIFSSVTAGLGVMAHRIAAGETELPAHHRPSTTASVGDELAKTNMRFLKRWIDIQEEVATATDTARLTLVQLMNGLLLRATPLPQGMSERQVVALPHEAVPPLHAALATMDERVLVVTTSYRFLLTTPRRLLVLEELGLRLNDVEQFAPGERIATLTRWSDVTACRWLVVMSAGGEMRLLDLAKLLDALNRALPVQLEQKPGDAPVAVLGAAEGQQIAIITSAARALRLEVGAAAAVGIQALKRDRDETIVAVLPLRGADQLVLVAANGATRVVRADEAPLRGETSARGKVIALRHSVQTAALQTPVWLLTSRALRPFESHADTQAARKAARDIALDTGEQVIALLNAG